MSVPNTRQEFGKWCLRKLGAPVIEINVSDEQVDDRIDEALEYYADFHMDGTEKVYWKHQITANNFPGKLYSLNVDQGGGLYQNNDTLSFSTDTGGAGANGYIITNSNGMIVNALLSANGNGSGFVSEPSVTINTSTGNSGQVSSIVGGFIQLPDNVIGMVNIFDIGSSRSGIDTFFDVKYQLILNDLYNLTNLSIVPYYMLRQQLTLIEEVLNGKPTTRYSRHSNRLYYDSNWADIHVGNWMIVEGSSVIDPAKTPGLWSDKWLQAFATALIKQQWGSNLKKFQGLPMPGGIMWSGQQIYDEATQEVAMLKEELINTYSIPSSSSILYG